MRLARERVARRTIGFTESVIREMTRLSTIHGAINLAQGFPNFPAPSEVKEAAKRALDANATHYGPSAGLPELREAIAKHTAETRGVPVSPR